MIFASIWLILGVIRVKLESGNANRVRKLTQLTRVTRLELQALIWSENLDNLIFLCLSVLPSYCSTNFAKISSALLMLVVLSFRLLPALELESKSTRFQIWIRIQLWNIAVTEENGCCDYPRNESK